MPDAVNRFVSPDALAWLGVGSLVCFVATLVIVPIVLVRLPANYFHQADHGGRLRRWHPAVRIAAYAVKNVLGAVFLLGGLAMLLLPGQGILTMVMGQTRCLLVDHPSLPLN